MPRRHHFGGKRGIDRSALCCSNRLPDFERLEIALESCRADDQIADAVGTSLRQPAEIVIVAPVGDAGRQCQLRATRRHHAPEEAGRSLILQKVRQRIGEAAQVRQPGSAEIVPGLQGIEHPELLDGACAVDLEHRPAGTRTRNHARHRVTRAAG